MSKTLKIILFSTILGMGLAIFFFLSIKEKAEAKNKPILYVFQVGVFKNKENASNYKMRFSLGKVFYDGEFYRVYIGLTVKNKELLSTIFDNLNYNYYIKEISVKEEFMEEIIKYDELLEKSQEENRLLIIKNMLESANDELQN